MDFGLTEEEKDIRGAAREFAEKEFPDRARECDLNDEFPRDIWKKACDLGFVAPYVPEEYNGVLDAINKGSEMPLKEALSFETDEFLISFASEDAKEGISAFIEKRKATFKGK